MASHLHGAQQPDAELVPELAAAMKLSKDHVVELLRCVYGLVNSSTAASAW